MVFNETSEKKFEELGVLREFLGKLLFSGRWIGRAGIIAWIPRFPDFTHLDFVLRVVLLKLACYPFMPISFISGIES